MPQFELKNNSLTIKINSFGAELCSVKLNETSIEYIWQADKTVWARHAPNLFPIVGKLKNGEFIYNDNVYQLSQHGFARDMEFDCVLQTENKLVFELKSSSETLAKFPFEFIFNVIYLLQDNQVDVIYKILNPTEQELLFSVGAHPAFNCPLEPNESFNDYSLEFKGKDNLIVNLLNDGLLTSNTREIKLENNSIRVNKELFSQDALVCVNTQIEEVSLVSRKSKHGVSMKSVDWPYFGIWSKKDSEQFVCLEPWYGIADSANTNGKMEEKMGIIKLITKEQFECSFNLAFF